MATPAIQAPQVLQIPYVPRIVSARLMAPEGLEPSDALPIELQIRNNYLLPMQEGSFYILVFEDACFFESGPYYVPSLQSAETKVMSISVKARAQENLHLLPDQIELVIFSSDGNEKGNFFFKMSMEPYFKKLLTKDKLRILLWGLFGTGKSSFVSSLYSTLDPNPPIPGAVQQYAVAQGSDTSVTLNLVRYIPGARPANGIRETPNVNVEVIDTWGYEMANDLYPDYFWGKLIDGSLPDGFPRSTMKDQETFNKFLENPKYRPDSNKEPNVVFVAMTYSAALDPKYLEKIQTKVMPQFRDRGFSPIILLTQVDMVNAVLRKDPYSPSHEEKITNIRNTVASKLRVPMNDIVPVVNYSQEHFRTFGIDRCIYVALRLAFIRCKESAAARKTNISIPLAISRMENLKKVAQLPTAKKLESLTELFAGHPVFIEVPPNFKDFLNNTTSKKSVVVYLDPSAPTTVNSSSSSTRNPKISKPVGNKWWIEIVPVENDPYGDDSIEYNTTSGERKKKPIKVLPCPEDLLPPTYVVGNSQFRSTTNRDAALPIANVEVHFMNIKTKQVAAQGKTRANGTVDTPALENGTYEVVFKFPGFTDHYITGCTVFGQMRRPHPMHVCISKKLSPNESRFILRWGSTPKDLDLHCIGPDDCHVFFSKPKFTSPDGVAIELDIDVREGNGPETITMKNPKKGKQHNYHLLVHNFSKEGPLCHSGASLAIVFEGTSREVEMYATEDQAAIWWHVGSLDIDSGAFKMVNQFYHDNAVPTLEQLNKIAFPEPATIKKS